jgi:hypothetical protein
MLYRPVAINMNRGTYLGKPKRGRHGRANSFLKIIGGTNGQYSYNGICPQVRGVT